MLFHDKAFIYCDTVYEKGMKNLKNIKFCFVSGVENAIIKLVSKLVKQTHRRKGKVKFDVIVIRINASSYTGL